MNMNIGQAATESGVSAKMIRYYESIGLLRPAARSTAGYRQYGPADVQTLRFIRRSRDLGFSLDRIGTLLQLWQDTSRKSQDVKALARLYIAELDEDIRKLQSLREQVEQMAQACHGDNRPQCPILEKLSGDPQPGAQATHQRLSK